MRKKEDFFDVTTLSDEAIKELAKFLTIGIDDTTIFHEVNGHLLDLINRLKRSGNETTLHIALSKKDKDSSLEKLEMTIHEREHTQRYGALHDVKVLSTEITFYRDTNRLYSTILGHWDGNISPLQLVGEWEAGYKKSYQAFTQEQMDSKAKEFSVKVMRNSMENRDEAYERFKRVMDKHPFGLSNAPTPRETLVSLKEGIEAVETKRGRGLSFAVPMEMDTIHTSSYGTLWNADDVTFHDDKKDAVTLGPIPWLESMIVDDIKKHHDEIANIFCLPPELLNRTVDVEVRENAERIYAANLDVVNSDEYRESSTGRVNLGLEIERKDRVSFDSEPLTKDELEDFATKLGADHENMSEPFVPTWISDDLTPRIKPQMITRHMSQALPMPMEGRVMVQEEVSDEVVELMNKYPSEEKKSPKVCVIGGHGLPLGKIAADAIIASGGLAIPLATYGELHRHHGVQSSTPRRHSVIGMSPEEYMEWDDQWRQGPRTFSTCHLIPPMSIRERSDRDDNLNELYDPSVTPEELEEAEEAISKPVAEVGILSFAKGLGIKLKTEVNKEPRVFGGKTKKKKRWNK